MVVPSNTNHPKVAIVILNYNGVAFLETFLEKVKHTEYATFDLIVADNDSSDNSLEFLHNVSGFKEYSKAGENKFATIKLEKNWGFAEGYNKALAQIMGQYKYYVLLNSDVEITEDWLGPIVDSMEADPFIAAAQPKILAFHDKRRFEYAGASGGMMDLLGYPFCRGRIFENLEEDNGQYDDKIEVFWATGAAMVVNADLYHTIGGLDGEYFAHMEEIDLCWRFKRAGYKVVVCPKSVVYHIGGGTLPKNNSRKTYLNFRNSLLSVLKNAPPVVVVAMVLARLILDSVAGVRFLFKKEYANIFAVVKAHFSFYYHLPMYIVKRFRFRAKLKRIRVGKSNMKGLYRGSVVWEYFIRGVGKYSEL